MGSLSIGIVMQRGPPRARDSSLEQSEITAGPPPSRSCVAGHDVLIAQDPPAAPRQLFHRLVIAPVEQDQPGGDGEGVGAVGPLLALLVDRLLGAAAGDDLELHPKIGQHPQQRRAEGEGQLLGVEVDRVDVGRLRPAGLDDRQVGQAEIAVDQGEDGIEVHVGAPARQLDHDQMAEGGLLPAQVLGERLDPPPVGPLRQPDEEDLRAHHQHVAPLQVRIGEVRVVLRRARGGDVDLEQPRGAGERRVVLEDGAGEERLALAGAGRHRGDHHAVAHHHLRIALKEVVGHRIELEELQAVDVRDLGRSADPLDQRRGERPRRQLVQPAHQAEGGAVLGLELVEQPLARLRVRQHVREQILRLEHLHPGLPQHLGEEVVLLARLVAVEDVVEEQGLHHGGDHPIDLPPRPVDQDAAQASDFRIDLYRHA